MLIDQPPKEEVKPTRPRKEKPKKLEEIFIKETKERVKNDEWKEENPNMGGNLFLTPLCSFENNFIIFCKTKVYLWTWNVFNLFLMFLNMF